MANAGIDQSTLPRPMTPAGSATAADPDAARQYEEALSLRFDVPVCGDISDSFGRAWRRGPVALRLVPPAFRR